MSAATVSPLLLADAVADARTQLTRAQSADLDNHTAAVGSHAALEASLRRVLWVLNAEVA